MVEDASADLPRSPREVSRFLRSAFKHHRGIGRRLTLLRPFICPFEELLIRMPRGDNISVLDVGCGVGIMSALAAGLCGASRVIGFDIAPGPIAIAQGLRAPHSCDLSFHTLPAGQFPDGLFDVVLCVDVLHHVPPEAHRDFLRLVASSVAPGGLLLFKDISPRPWWKALANRMHDLVTTRHLVHYWHERIIEDWLRETPGRIEESTRLDRLWYSHYLVVWRRAT